MSLVGMDGVFGILRHNNRESSRDSSEDQESSVTYLIALVSAKTFNKHPPLFAENLNLIIANS